MRSVSTSVVCPQCKAGIGEWCRAATGRSVYLKRPHKARAAAYLESLTKAKPKGKAKVIGGKLAGKDHAVISLTGGSTTYRREPCARCPWRVDATGEFPAEAFKHSASTAYDMSTHTFACHDSGKDKPAMCAGFLLRGADNNLAVRLNLREGVIDLNQVRDGGHALHDSYRAMAVANGLDPADPAIAPCRP